MKTLITALAIIAAAAYADTVVTNKDGKVTTVSGDATKIEITTPVVQPTPPPIVTGINKPFPQHTLYLAGIKPTTDQASKDLSVQKLYDAWKATSLKQACGGYYVPKGDKLTVSEGIGYGMLITVAMAGYDAKAKEYFDGLYAFSRKFPATATSNDLMAWAIKADCTPESPYPAVDGDLDIALSLLMADKQWGSAGSIPYLAEAKKVIAAIKAKLVNQSYGYIAGGNSPDITRTSDVMPGHFKAFKAATDDTVWDIVNAKSLVMLSNAQLKYAPSTGLIPDFLINANTANPSPSPGNRMESAFEGYYWYNACRIPWRLASDYVLTGDTRSRDIAQKIIAFFRNTSGNDPSKVYAEYSLLGTPKQYNSLSFQGPLVAGAMVSGDNQTFLNNLWTTTTQKLAGNYYDNELQLLSVMVASGNWWTP